MSPEVGKTTYYLTNDGVVARRLDGWRSQVWQPNSKKWADWPDLDVAGECQEITDPEVLRDLESGEFGEFTPEEREEDPSGA